MINNYNNKIKNRKENCKGNRKIITGNMTRGYILSMNMKRVSMKKLKMRMMRKRRMIMSRAMKNMMNQKKVIKILTIRKDDL